ncbi:MAG: FixH family protein [Deltaproteobacteria bacterium]
MSRNQWIIFINMLAIVVFAFFLVGFTKKGIETEQGHYLLNVEFPGKLLKVGQQQMTLLFLDRESGKPVTKKLDLEIIPWMRAAEHDASELPKVTYLDNGKYQVERLYFNQEGAWEIYIRIDKDNKEDAAVFDVDVIE